ncbi:protein TolR [Sphingomonas quercus]|uniref:Protein TolR n=1 Tax=Sphingomonas quercus TaxID=2842451 RepID=A0ABS6BFB0_9SPHN|nr:protein TolR [Sphingomonas quercus]MBU3076864.1 protein TolR [Sphingomonas quercus]
MAMSPIQSGGRGRRGRAPMAEINVTPLVDVMLVLLIIFMVTAPLLVTGVPVNLPDSRAGALDQKQQPVQISIDAQGQTFVDDQQVATGVLPERLAAIATGPEGRERQVYLRADASLDYGRVMAVMGELNRAGLNKVALVSSAANNGAAADQPGEAGEAAQ